MSEYSTLIVLNENISERVEFFREFLEKSEFETLLNEVHFTHDNSADGFPSAELSCVRNCLYLFGEIDSKEYERIYNQVEQNREENPNPNYYMLFCQGKYDAYSTYRSAGGSVKKTFSIGILNDEQEDRLQADSCAIKLLALALAISSYNQGPGNVLFDNYYVTANVELNIDNVYCAVLHKLSEYTDKINIKKKQIKANEEIIVTLNKKRPKMCKGNFSERQLDELAQLLKPVSEYGSIEKMRQDMETAYEYGVKRVSEDITGNIVVARRAIASANKNVPFLYEIDSDGQSTTLREAVEIQDYMNIEDTDERTVPKPDDLLERGNGNFSFDSQRIYNLFPLARELEETGKPKASKIFGASLCAILLFVVGVCSVYALRYYLFGTTGASTGDIINLIGLPILSMLAASIVGLIALLIAERKKKSLFLSLYTSLQAFLKNATQLSNDIKKYINKYLTVYYNYHLKHARISDLNSEIDVLKKEIEDLEDESSFYNAAVDRVCTVSEKDFDVLESELAEKRKDFKNVSEMLKEMIKQTTRTETKGINTSSKIISPWISSISYETGNINGGTQ